MVLSSPCYVFLPVVHSTGMHVLKIKGKTREGCNVDLHACVILTCFFVKIRLSSID